MTGASRGIGAAIARRLAEDGADIVGVARSEDSLGPTARAVAAASRGFTAVGAALESRDAVYDAIAAIRPLAPSILVHAAGINRRAPAESHGDELWDEVLAVNLTAPFILTRELGGDMVARGSGKVVFVASLLSFQGGLTVPGYAASKGGIAQLTKAFANEWAPRGVNVNAIAPGYVSTDMNEALLDDPVRLPQITARIPAERWGSPDDMAGAVAFLASADAAYVHGTVLTVDGGWMGR
ncbi:SDR family oxidoreductase [Microbacterium sp. M3]|uniref:SDR family oxidoreductase n=1 Tax=Microbacterium arthrosphaerae TaxID=792652 RepID=A0ABU4GY71_9MICO|nr:MULTISPECIES: SDR family oxidoreductase [Microbacterium]MDW4571965.1 SDR family oxidoreductase [Microbacterium arthrosphaerae]MDW7605820.1 SDR family oxidoreductase [Microbacterium sp. M3]